MASIFTYDPEPPRVSSPWSTVASSGRVTPALTSDLGKSGPSQELRAPSPSNTAFKLDAEPQEGPTEYKLHLLLRARRSASASGFGRSPGATQRNNRRSSAAQSLSSSAPDSPIPAPSVTATRQHRLEQLTTQLLWRLQQSSPHHSASINNLVLPSLPKATPELHVPERLAKLLPGLEESDGALYEIGVSDDGTLVGITNDEMDESLTNLRAMAASLGCAVEVLRMVPVGVIEADTDAPGGPEAENGTLYVAEAYIKPVLQSRNVAEANDAHIADAATAAGNEISQGSSAVEQIRISLTGATTSGKSSLLGTLSTSTLDNGRGKSRLSLLKHRHEIASGVTSSVVQELLGYQADKADGSVNVLNYASENVSTWNDIQASPDLNRVALLSDSAGHPRFRRTTVRGLVGWAPHWTLLCIAANEDHSSFHSNQDGEGASSGGHEFAGANAHISVAHLELCLKLGRRLVVVITKFDEATRNSFRQLLSSLLTRLKDAGRRPLLLPNDTSATSQDDLQFVGAQQLVEIRESTKGIESKPLLVPILFTSAVKGTGIQKLHALLSSLPTSTKDDNVNISATQRRPTFHIDDSFNLPVSTGSQGSSSAGSVISGYQSHASLSVGDVMFLGPVVSPSSPRQAPRLEDLPSLPPSAPSDPFLEPRSFREALSRTTSSPRLRASDSTFDWRPVRIVSIRNLRLSVHTLHADQVGTIGVVPIGDEATGGLPTSIRKGMVLTEGSLSATHTFTARFDADEATSIVVGSVVVVYCRSVRAGARVVAIALDGDDEPHGRQTTGHKGGASDGESTFGSFEDNGGFLFDDEPQQPQEVNGHTGGMHAQQRHILVTLQFVACKEYIEEGAQVLVMPSGGAVGSKDTGLRGLIGGLEGLVGSVVQTYG